MSAEAAERAFVERFRVRFGADASLSASGDVAHGAHRDGTGPGAACERDVAAEDEELSRLLPRLGGSSRRKRRPVASSGPTPTLTSSSRPPELLRRFLWTLFRRFSGRMLVQGRLLNLDELLVTRFARVDPSHSASRDGRTTPEACISIREGSVRLVVRCVGADAAQIGQDAVLARLVAAHDVDAQLLEAEDASERGDDVPLHSSRPVAVVMPTKESGVQWSSQQVIEDMEAVYGFDMDAFASFEGTVASEYSDEEMPLNARLASTSLLYDLRGSDKMMEMFNVPPETFQSFAWAATAARRQPLGDRPEDRAKDAADPWSYRELDSAQKRKWADERYEYGLELVEKRKVREALTEFESALKLDERHAGAQAAKGRAHMTARQLQDAVDCLERAVELDRSLAGAQDDLLRAKSMLAHSRHVSSGTSYELNEALRDCTRASAPDRDGSPVERPEPRRSRSRKEEDCRPVISTKSAKSLEEERLRLLLEEDKRKREKKHKKEKRKHRKSDRKRKSKRDSRQYESDDSSSASRSSRSSDASRRSHRRRSPRAGSKSREDEDKPGDLPAILSRAKHRIWN